MRRGFVGEEEKRGRETSFETRVRISVLLLLLSRRPLTKFTTLLLAWPVVVEREKKGKRGLPSLSSFLSLSFSLLLLLRL